MHNKNICKICGNSGIHMYHKNYPGFVENTFFDIYRCNNCNTNFSSVKISSEELNQLYEKIYSNKNAQGYDKYIELARNIKQNSNPVKYLSKFHASYFGIFKELRNINNKTILDVGCGLGYLTFVLNKLGHKVTGLDVSSNAIKYAKENFGDLFVQGTIDELLPSTLNTFDYVIASEIIEHLLNPIEFLQTLLKFIRPGGKIIVTTPNKDYMNERAIWYTDLPPVHLYWFSKKSIEVIAGKIGVEVDYIKFNNYYPSDENRLIKYVPLRKEHIQKHVVDENFEPFQQRMNFYESTPRQIIKKIMHNFAPARNLSNFIYNHTIEKDLTMVAVFTKPVNSIS